MSKLRVHELARELGRQNREVIEFLKSKGVDVRSHMSMVDEPAVSEVKNRFRKDNNNRGKEHIAKLETPKTEEKVVTAKSEVASLQLFQSSFAGCLGIREDRVL